MFADERFIILRSLFEKGQVIGIAVVANCHCQITQIAPPFGAFDGTMFEALIKLNG